MPTNNLPELTTEQKDNESLKSFYGLINAALQAGVIKQIEQSTALSNSYQHLVDRMKELQALQKK